MTGPAGATGPQGDPGDCGPAGPVHVVYGPDCWRQGPVADLNGDGVSDARDCQGLGGHALPGPTGPAGREEVLGEARNITADAVVDFLDGWPDWQSFADAATDRSIRFEAIVVDASGAKFVISSAGCRVSDLGGELSLQLTAGSGADVVDVQLPATLSLDGSVAIDRGSWTRVAVLRAILGD